MKNYNVIEIVDFFPNKYSICWSCLPALKSVDISLTSLEKESKDIPEDIWREYIEISRIIRLINKEFPGRFYFRLIDSASMLGLWKTIRYRIKKTPCLIYRGRKILEGFPEKHDVINNIKVY